MSLHPIIIVHDIFSVLRKHLLRLVHVVDTRTKELNVGLEFA